MRFLVLAWLEKPEPQENSLLPAQISPTQNDEQLKPAEIAYLVRGGDTSHALIVLAVDLIQRRVKKEDGGLCDYELNMWTIVKDSVSLWAKKKAKDAVIGNSYDPRALVKRLSFLYLFLTRTLTGSMKAFLQEAITDPKRLRRYFSYQAILRILADFTSAGFKQSFEQELRMSLLRRGLIVGAQRRNSAGRILLVAALLGIAGTGIIAFTFTCSGNLAACLTIWTTSLLVAFAARALWLSRTLIPLYEELAVVARQVKRKSFRLEILIFILRSFNVLSSALIIGLALFWISLGLALARLVYPSIGQLEIIAIVGFCLVHLFVAQIAFESFAFCLSDYPTARARHALFSLKRELTDVSPLDAFKVFLASPDYDPTLSKLVAIYGIETLLIFV